MSFVEDSRIITINSRDRTSGTTSDFFYSLDLPSGHTFDSVVVLSALIPKSYYLIGTGRNTFTLIEDASSTIISVPIGSYGRTSLKNTLQTLLNASSPKGYTYTVSVPNATIGAETGKYTFSVTGNGLIQPIFQFTTSLNEETGFDANSSNQFSASSLTSTNVIRLQLEDSIMICSDCCDGGNNGILQEMLTTSNPDFSEVVFQQTEAEAYTKKLIKTDHIHIWICDENIVPIDINGSNVVITLLIYKKSNIYTLIKDFLKFQLLKS